MRRRFLLFVLLIVGSISFSQDFTNKGKEFWIGYGNHQQMYGPGGGLGMDIYITSDVNTTVIVEIPGLAISNSYTITANQVTQIPINDGARLDAEGISNKGIHVVAEKPVVVYAHIYFASVSGATLCLPVSTLGREYYSVNFTQVAQPNVSQNSYSYFFVVATENNTTVEIVPSAATQQWAAGSINRVTLNKGQIYQVLGSTDLTGSTIQSVNTGEGCKKIAVYCGSGRIGIGCSGTVSSSDNLFQQMYPNSTWGKKYLTVPSMARPMNYYRIIRPDPSTVVTVDNVPISPSSFVNGFYYQFNDVNAHVIEGSKPILVAQYFTTQGCGEQTNNGDPEMIFLNPVEQTISKVTLTSMRLINTAANAHYINAVVRNSPGAISSFKIDGNPFAGSFVPHPDPAYVYTSIPVSLGTHTITCDTPFNAVAYGFGGAESYGYSAGTNLKDLYQYVTISNDYATVNFPASCKSTPFRFAMTFPYKPIEIKWKFNGLFADRSMLNPEPDSSWVVDGRTLYRFKLPNQFSVANVGTYPIKVIANNPTSDGCSGEQEIEYDLQIFEPPVGGGGYKHSGCIADSVALLDESNTYGRTVSKYYWDFGDGETGLGKEIKHKYQVAGDYTVKHAIVTDVGCLSDTIKLQYSIAEPPVAKFGISNLTCEKQAITFSDSSTTKTGTIAKWMWDFGDGRVMEAFTRNAILHTYAQAGSYTVKLKVQTISGCPSEVFTKVVTVYPTPLANFNLPVVCLPNPAAFSDVSSISDGSQQSFTHAWNFGDGQTSAAKSPSNIYTSTGPFNIKLTITSNNGCTDDTVKILSTVYDQPVADFSTAMEVCVGATNSFTDKSVGKGSTITKWQWDFSDGNIGVVQNPTHTFATANAYPVKLTVTTDKGCVSRDTIKQIIINALPDASFAITSAACETEDIQLSDRSVANAGNVSKWTWDHGNGTTSKIQNPVIKYSREGVYQTSLIVETDKGCTSKPFLLPVRVNDLPTPNFIAPEVCLSDPFAEFKDSSYADNGSSSFTYNWNFGDGGTSTAANPQHKYVAAGTYNIRLAVTTQDGCTKDTVRSFTVNGAIVTAGFGIENSGSLCANADVVIRNTSTVNIGNVVRVEVYWDYNNDPTNKTVDEFPAPGKTYAHKYPTFGSPATKTFQVQYVAYSGINCIHQVSQNVTINASPDVVFDAPSGVCEEVVPYLLTGARETFGFPGSGVYSGNGINAAGMFNPAAARPGTHTIRYTFNAANGCSTFKEQTIRVYPTPKVNAGPDRTLLEGGVLTLQSQATGNNLTYLWSPSIGLDNINILTPKVSSTEDITYKLTATSADGCVADDEVFVKILKEPKVPNVFSPNGDGINDQWVIQFLDSYPGCTVEIFNRYGQKVYQSTGYSKPWDGMINGNPLPIGTYYWIINPKNGRKQMNGSVTILR